VSIKWYARDGSEITLEQADELLGDYDYKRVELTEVGPYTVSTVWLGLDHGFRDNEPPVIFETMVFTTTAWNEERSWDDPEHEPLLDMDCVRYCTEHEARIGHQDMVTLIRATYVEDPYETPSEAPFDPEK